MNLLIPFGTNRLVNAGQIKEATFTPATPATDTTQATKARLLITRDNHGEFIDGDAAELAWVVMNGGNSKPTSNGAGARAAVTRKRNKAAAAAGGPHADPAE
jgi:hypothetical protein